MGELIWKICAGLTLLLAGLGWVGWSFFYRATPALPLNLSWPSFAAGRWVGALQHGLRQPWGGLTTRLHAYLARRQVATPLLNLAWRQAWHWKYALWVGGGVLLLAGSIWATFSIGHDYQPAPLPQRASQHAEQISSALSLEKLVPPPPLPPTAFIDRQHPGLERLDRDWGRLDPQFVQLVLKLRAQMQARGYPLALVEGYRSPERQDQLAGMHQHVTNARGGQSKHQYGFAADLAPVRDGRIVISERDPWAMAAYLAMGEEAEALGLVWGGRWSFRDYGHVELRGSIASLLKSRPAVALGRTH